MWVCLSEDRHIYQSRSLGQDSNSCSQAAAVESQSIGSLQSRRSRSGRICGKRSLEPAETRGNVRGKGGGNQKKTGVGQVEGTPAVVVKRGRGRPRKVCITLTTQYSVTFVCAVLS